MLSRSRGTQYPLSLRSPLACKMLREAIRLLGVLLLALSLMPLGLIGGAATAYAAGILTVKVYNDAGRDGVDTGGAEQGVGEVSVAVYSVDDLLVALNNTNASGVASFPNLPPARYRVEVGAPAGYAVSVPGAANSNPGLLAFVDLTADSSVSVGLRPLAAGADLAAPAGTRSVTTRVWDDADSDGVQDANEPGLTGLSLELVDSINAVRATSTEGDDGRYRFDQAPAGVTLSVRVQNPPSGYALTRRDASGDIRDSDGVLTPAPAIVASVPVGATGANIDSVDIGFARAAVAGFVWRDINADGSFDPFSEPRLNGVTVELLDGAGATVLTSTTTRAQQGDGAQDGVYQFAGLAFGSYRVRIPAGEFEAGALLFGAATPPDAQDRGRINGVTAAGVPDPALDDYVETLNFTLSNADIAGGSNRNVAQSFGFYKGAAGNLVWYDADRNGVQSGPAEVGENGILVFVDDGRGGGTPGDGIRNGGEITTVTANDPNTGLPGYYRFDDLPLGATASYTVTLDRSNFEPGDPLAGLGTSTATRVVVGGGAYFYDTSANLTAAAPTDFGVDFGLTRAELGNVVFLDANGDGQRQISEPGIPGVTVRLVSDFNDATVFTRVTDGAGAYTIPNLSALPYYATFDLSTAAGYEAFVGSPQPVGVAIDPANSASTIDYSDLNPEPVNGLWTTGVFTPTAGEINYGVDAGFYELVTVAGRAFFDSDGDDQDNAPAEPGMRGVTVELYREGVVGPVATTTTALADTGVYTFTAVAPGAYEVQFTNPEPDNFAFVAPAQPDAVSPLASDADASGRTPAFTITSGAPLADVDAGFTGRADLSGRVFLDADGSSTQNDGPDSLIGATATLTVTVDRPGRLVVTYNPVNTLASPTLNSNPSYAYAGLPGGTGVTYDLAIAPPDASYTPVTADFGADDSIDSDGPTVKVTDPAAGGSFDYDQGYFTDVTITARVFEESAGAVDNSYQLGNPGLSGVTVSLETAAGTLVSSDTTDATGLVTFTVAPGDYRLNLDESDTDLGGRLASPGHSDPVAVFGTPLVVGENSLTDTAGNNSFGYYEAATITGKVFFDRNLDNLLAGEPGVQGVSVTAIGPSTPAAVTTDATGTYTITGLLPGNYTVRFSNPGTTNFAFISAGDSDVILPGAFPSSDTGSISVGYNAVVSNVDVGFIGRSTVSGTTFLDGNANGLQGDADDADLDGVTANLTVAVNIPNQLATTIARSATTAAGAYSFAGLPGGAGVTFGLSFTPPTAAPAYVATLADQGDDALDSDGAAQLTDQALPMTTTQDRDQGFYQPVTITARVFDEASGPIDNRYQAGNPGIANVTVTLEPNGGGTAVATGTTNATGVVTFTVSPGNYQLNVDENDAELAGLTEAPGHTDPVAAFGTPFVSGDQSLTDTAGNNSFGYSRTATVRGAAFFDRNLDGLKATEPGVQGVTVNLRDATGTTVLTSTTTSATGVYSFAGLEPASYIVEFVNPDDTNFTFFTGADSDIASAVTGRTGLVAVAYGATVENVDGGLVGLATASGYTFVDDDYSGQSVDPTDADLPNVTVSLTATINIANRLSTTITRSGPSAADGSYSFGGLPGGAGVSIDLGFRPPVLSPAWTPTRPDVGADETDSDGAASLTTQSITAGGTLSRDRGYYQPVTITARVFDERDIVNNLFAGGDLGLPGVTVTLSVGPQNLVTDGSGLVTFETPPAANVTLTVADPAGFIRSPGNGGSATLGTLTSGMTRAASFGYYKDSAFQGSAWYDADGDGAQDLDEPGMENITVTLVGDVSNILATTTTGADGSYAFTQVKPTGGAFPDSSYRVCFSSRAGFAFTAKGATLTADGNSDVNIAAPDLGCTDTFTVKSDTSAAYIDAGYVGALSIGDRVWTDVDGDGIQDAGEPGLGGVAVTVAITTTGGAINSTNPTITLVATSAANAGETANYQITRVPPASGWRVVSVAAPFGYVPSPADQGGDDALDSDPVGSFGPAVAPIPADLDFGFYQATALGDLVWIDLNGNGAFDAASEQGVPGIRVDLLKDGAPIKSVTTSAQAPLGGYAFLDLVPGTYSVRFVLPAGYRFVNDGAGATDTDNDNDAKLDGTTAAVTLTSGQARATLDAGVVGTGSVGGIAWVDENQNDIREAVDVERLAGVQVTLTLTPTLIGAPVTYSAVTAADGSYSFAALPPGAGVVRFTASGPYRPVAANVGSDAFDSDGPAAPVTIAAGQAVPNVDQGYKELGRKVWLPLLANEPPRSDLSVSFKVSPATPIAGKATSVEVTVTNTGDGPASGFWVDFYINPTRAPLVNEPWKELCALEPCFGIAWFYEGTLQPGQSIILNSQPASATNPNGFRANASNWPGFFANGTRTLYAFVDSWNRDATGSVKDPNGALREHNETNNRAQQSITVLAGPLPPEFPSGGLSSPSDFRTNP